MSPDRRQQVVLAEDFLSGKNVCTHGFMAAVCLAGVLRSVKRQLHSFVLGVTVDFMCQPGWTTGCLDVWSNIILGAPVRVFWDDIHV